MSDTMSRNWVWPMMIATASGATCSLLLPVTGAQDARVANPPIAQTGWLTFDQCLVVAPESYEITAKEGGVIAELTIRENDLVKSGQSIGQIDSENAEIERQLAGMQAQMAKSEASDESGVRLAKNKADDAALHLESSEEMQNKGGASTFEVRQKKLAVEHENWILKQKQLEYAKRQLQAKHSELAYQLADLKVSRMRLNSPATGVVNRVDRRAGETVTVGNTIAKVIRLDELRVDFFVDIKQVDLTSLPDQPVTIAADLGVTGNKTFAGKITGYASEVGSTGKVRVSATVQNQQINDRWVLLPGMPAVLKLAIKSQ
ncbi:MAG: efflux RND transporter periplasmic adaptor subunit [Pirellula sp.]